MDLKEAQRIKDNPDEWPEPTVERPDDDTLVQWTIGSEAKATDGCRVEPDGVCPHGHVSWLVHEGVM